MTCEFGFYEPEEAEARRPTLEAWENLQVRWVLRLSPEVPLQSPDEAGAARERQNLSDQGEKPTMTNQPQYPNHPPFENGQSTAPRVELAPPTAWQSIPSPVRFAVWVWAISVILSVAGAALFAVLFVLGLAAGLGSL